MSKVQKFEDLTVQIIRASDVGFIDNETATKLYNDCLNLSKSISKLIQSLKGSPISGLKNLKPEP